jgi:sigma-B regulation protein RsbU (phosphoserine phosphatase)
MRGNLLRRTIQTIAVVVACAAAQLVAQESPPQHPPAPKHSFRDLFRPAKPKQPLPSGSDSSAPAIFDATALGSPVRLDRSWRVGISADQAPAAPDFDDSAWAVRDANGSMADVPDEDERDKGEQGSDTSDKGPRIEVNGQSIHPHGPQRFAWFRLHARLAQNHGPVALYLEMPVSQNTSMAISSTGPGVDVYANGKPVPPNGPHGDNPQGYQQISRIYDLNVPPSETSLVLVVRTLYIPFGPSAYTSLFASRKLLLGNRGDLESALELWSAHGLFERLPRLVNSILLLVLALFLLALYFTQRGHIEYLWLALHELVQAPIGFVDLAGSSARLDQFWYAATVLQLILISAYFYFEFLISFLSLRRRWYILLLRYTSPILAGVAPTLLLVGRGPKVIGVVLAFVFLGSLVWLIGWTLFVFITLVAATVKRNFEAGLLLIPLVLSIVGMVEPVVTAGMSDFGGHEYHSPLTIQAGPIPIHFASIADSVGIFVIVLIIFVRFLRIQRNQERVSSELAAARSVQELMIPQEKLETPGFEVDSIYNPANEVGGDFFHVETTKDGGLLVVIGDVAGKGLKAAMNVSMLMGALRRTPDRSPSKILESLNRVLVGSDSFTTCQAAWFGANGELVLSNAGHLPPYLNSQEITLPGGLPLGVLADNTYEDVRLYLHPGDRILLMSDGVVEARAGSGELFGFDRVHNLSNQSAFYIADAAKAFGQEDDITVLTVRRMAEAMAA